MAARELVSSTKYCWAINATADGGAQARLMGCFPMAADADDWKIVFLTDRRSRKAAEIRRTGRLTLAYQRDKGDDYAVLGGRASMNEDRAELRASWQRGWETFFPEGPDLSSAAFIRVDVDRIELCIRGVSPEPFGSRYAALERDAARRWSVAAE
ncbi:MAG TPA: pyridoxamine 5'-phosphate oxidase family protein [Stellaceae bacterium]|nr:pyridoxamine 5'-phosphate oxidase family protein [Stellaceae bacterium]